MVRKVIGIVILVSVFALLFLATAQAIGLKDAAKIWGFSAGLVVLTLIAIALITI